MKVAVGFDHAGVPFHDVVLDAVRAEGHEPVDVGTQDDYPGHRAGRFTRRSRRGLRPGYRRLRKRRRRGRRRLQAARHPCRRRATTPTPPRSACSTTTATCSPSASRVIGPMLAAACVRAFVNAAFSGEERHVRRLGKIDVMEQEGFGD